MTTTDPTKPLLTRNLPFYPAQDCPPSAPCGQRLSGPAEKVAYEANQLSNAEAAALKRAALSAQAELDSAKPRVDTAVRRLAQAEGRFVTAKHLLVAYARSWRVGHAVDAAEAVRHRHLHDGPEDRRHRPRWARVLLWPTVLVAAVYDTAFFSAMLLRLIDAPSSVHDLRFWISLLPGVMITVGLLATGHWLAEALTRARAHRERRPTRTTLLARLVAWRRHRPARVDEREAQDLPWPQWVLPVAFTMTVLGILLVWAHIRGQVGPNEEAQPHPQAIALLILMFSLSAIAIKMIHYNRFADDAATTKAAVRKARWAYLHLRFLARRAVDGYVARGQELTSLLDVLESKTRQHIDAAWVGILEDRERHGLASAVAPDLVDVAVVECHTGEPCPHPTFTELGEPQVCLRLIQGARAGLDAHDFGSARAQVAAVLTEIEHQWAPLRGPTGPAAEVQSRSG